MSKDVEPGLRTIRNRLLVSRVLPRVNVWSPIGFKEAAADVAAMGESIVKLFQPNCSDAILPDPRIHLIKNLYSNKEIRGVTGRQVLTDEEVEYILYSGTLMVPYYSQPAETGFVLLQSRFSDKVIKDVMRQARKNLADLRKPSGVPRYLDGGR